MPFCQFNVTDFITQITVIDQPIILDVDFDTEICSNGSIEYDSLYINVQMKLEIFHTIGLQSLMELNGKILMMNQFLTLKVLLFSQLLMMLQDVQILDTINLNFTQTNADASFTSFSSAVLTCQGCQQFSFSVNNFNDSLYDYNWFIDGFSSKTIYMIAF